jgi:hypothetical protein
MLCVRNVAGHQLATILRLGFGFGFALLGAIQTSRNMLARTTRFCAATMKPAA